MNFLNYKKPAKEEKDYTFLFQKPEEYEVKVDEEGNYLTDLDSMEIPKTAYDSGEDITNAFMGYDVTEKPYVIGNVASEEESIPSFDMSLSAPESQESYDTIHDYGSENLYIPDPEHTLDYEPQYRDYLQDVRPSIEEEGEDVFNYKSYASEEEPEETESEEESDFSIEEIENYIDEDLDSKEDYMEDEEIESDEEKEEEEEEEESEEDEEEEKEEDIISKNMLKKKSKEIEEAIEYLNVYSSIKENINLAEKIKCLKEAGYSNDVISSVVSPKKKTIKESNKNLKLNKFIENVNEKKALKEIGKYYGLSLKEQKLFEDFATLQALIKTFKKNLRINMENNPTYEQLDDESRGQYKQRIDTIINVCDLLSSFYYIASASFIKRAENQPAQESSTENTTLSNQAAQAKAQLQQSFKRKNISLRLEEDDKLEKEITELDQYWITIETRLQKLTTDVNTINSKIQGKVSSLKAIGNVIKKGVGNLFRSVVSGIKGAKDYVKTKASQVKSAYDTEIAGQQAQMGSQVTASQSKI